MNDQLLKDLIFISPICALFLVSLFPTMIKVFRGNREPHTLVSVFIALSGVSLATGLTAVMGGAKSSHSFDDFVVFDGLSTWSSYLIYFVTTLCLLMSADHLATRGRQFSEYIFLLLSSAIGMILLIISNNLIFSFIAIEFMSLALYILIAMSREPVLSKEAAFKYFVLGSFASAVMLYGVAMIYGSVQSTSYLALTEFVRVKGASNLLFDIGLCFLIFGFAFKVSLFPLHAWTPDVYTGAPTPVTAFMAAGVKISVFITLLRLFYSNGYAEIPRLNTLLQWLAVLTMFIGNAAALRQSNLKRMLAYSSIAHSGYIFIGLISGAFGRNYQQAASSVVLYLFAYSVVTVGAFAMLSLFERRIDSRVTLESLKGTARVSPGIAASMTVLLLSLAGLPPTLGFFSKLYVFSAAIEQGFYWLVFWGLISSAMGAYFYLRPIVAMYMEEPSSTSEGGSQSAGQLLDRRGFEPEDHDALVTPTFQWITRLMVAMTAVLVVVLGVYSSTVIKAVNASMWTFSS